MSSNITVNRPTSEQIGELAQAFNQFNYFTTGSFRPGLWVVGNFSTIRYCSAYGGAAKIIDSVVNVLPYEFYFCQTLDRNTTSYYRTIQLLDANGIRNGGVSNPEASNSGSAARRTLGVMSWLSVGLVASAMVAVGGGGVLC
jgi:hypothetical protein